MSIAANAFEDLSSLELLNLQDNTISDLSVGVFSGLTVTQIDLSNNNLTALPLNLLANHADPSSITTFAITGNPVADGDGWEITTATVDRRCQQ